MDTTQTAPVEPAPYPVHVDGELDAHLSRGLWLVKWFLAIPHYLVLAVLWVAFAVTTVMAFFSILVTGRYPRSLFDFNVGVMRWTWRVSFYAYGALGTDRYPPFTLAEVPDYPAHLRVDYPDHLSRGLVLVKWWLLALPHYLVLALFVGGIGYGVRGADDDPVATVSLIGILVLVAGVVLLVTGSYPRRVFDLLLGLNRWVLRVAGYVSLMTDVYPPFSLDQGPHDPGAATRGAVDAGPGPSAARPVGEARPARVGWTPWRVTSVVVGSLLVVMGLGVAGAGATLAVADQTTRDADGFLMSGAESLTSDTFAITSGDLQVHTEGATGWLPEGVLGDVRVTATSSTGSDLFVGVARARDVAGYLAGVRHETLVEVRNGHPVYESTGGGAPQVAPTESAIWVASATGPSPRLTWAVQDGDWTVVLMAADGSAPVDAVVRVGAEVPVLDTLIAALLILAALVLVLGGVLVALPVRAAGRPAAAPQRM